MNFQKLYKFKVRLKIAFNKELKMRFLILFIVLNIFSIIDILQGNTEWIKLIPINLGILALYFFTMLYLMYPKLELGRRVNNGKDWNIKVPIRLIRKNKLKKLNGIKN